MLDWLIGLSHPDGEIVFFNDAAIGIATPLQGIVSYAERLNIFTIKNKFDSEKIFLKNYEDTGYIRMAVNEAVAFLDVAPIGPDIFQVMLMRILYRLKCRYLENVCLLTENVSI